MTPREAADTLAEACEGWPTPNRYTAALDVLAAAAERADTLTAFIREARENVDYWSPDMLVMKIDAALAAGAADSTGANEIWLCPEHGQVEAVDFKGRYVCPDATCHRTCQVAVGGTEETG